jgi:hypothetical protein
MGVILNINIGVPDFFILALPFMIYSFKHFIILRYDKLDRPLVLEFSYPWPPF